MTTSANVLHVIPSLADRYGGPSAAALGFCRALSAAGTSTLIATTDADGPGRLDVRLGERETYRGIPAVFFPRHLGESFKWSPSLSRWLTAHTPEFDLVHVHAVFSHSSIAAGRACRVAGVPYIVRPLGSLDPWSLSRHTGRKRILMALGVRRLLEEAARIHYTTHEEAELAEGVNPWLPERVVAPIGVDEDLFHVTGHESSGRPIVAVMSRLDPKKGIDLLISAFHDAAGHGELSEWQLVIAGDGDPAYVRTLRALAAGGPAAGRIEFRGWVSGGARGEFLSQARLFALPSQQENFGIALVEALAVGVAALVTPGVNLAATVQRAEAGWVCERTADAVAGALRLALTNGAELRRRGERARFFASQFRWSAVAQSLQRIYRDVRTSPSALTHCGEPT